MLSLQSIGETKTDPLACALFLIFAFVAAGVAQTAWLKSRFSQKFNVPLDFKMTYRGRRIFGENKTLRGFIVMPPATAGSFFLIDLFVTNNADLHALIWPISPSAFAQLGLWAGLGFMAGELPNSFLKRQLGIPPGGAPRQVHVKALFFLLDRLDSIVGMLIAVSMVVPLRWQTWLYMAIIGPVIHWFFSVILYWYGVKERPA